MRKTVVRSAIAREAVCPRCGGKFQADSWAAKYCSNKCRVHIAITDYDKKVIQEYRGVCKRVGLCRHKAFKVLVGNHKRDDRFYHFSIGYKITEERKNRYVQILRNFIDGMRAGLYDIVFEPYVHVLSYRKHLVRRMAPKEKVCTEKISSCPGAFYPGECPRNFTKCEMSRRVTHRKRTYSGDLAMLVRRMVDDERRNREAGFAGRIGPDTRIGTRTSSHDVL